MENIPVLSSIRMFTTPQISSEWNSGYSSVKKATQAQEVEKTRSKGLKMSSNIPGVGIDEL